MGLPRLGTMRKKKEERQRGATEEPRKRECTGQGKGEPPWGRGKEDVAQRDSWSEL